MSQAWARRAAWTPWIAGDAWLLALTRDPFGRRTADCASIAVLLGVVSQGKRSVLICCQGRPFGLSFTLTTIRPEPGTVVRKTTEFAIELPASLPVPDPTPL